MLKLTKQPLKLISDEDMLLMIEKAKRGGISQVCSKRYAEANNKYPSDYDASKDSSYLMYNTSLEDLHSTLPFLQICRFADLQNILNPLQSIIQLLLPPIHSG